MKVVIDVNVWISGFLWGGSPGKVLQLAYERKIDSYVSIELLDELKVTLQRHKFKEKLNQRNRTVEELLTVATDISQSVRIETIKVPNLRDDKDVNIVATAVAATADVLITGDLDILVLKSFRGIAMLRSTDFLALKESGEL